jgi:hypothetical protein
MNDLEEGASEFPAVDMDITELYGSPVGFGSHVLAEMLRKNGFSRSHIAG